MEEEYGLPFCSWVQSCTGKSHLSIFHPFSAIVAGPRFVDATPWQRDVTTLFVYCTWLVPGRENVCDQDIVGCSRTLLLVNKVE